MPFCIGPTLQIWNKSVEFSSDSGPVRKDINNRTSGLIWKRLEGRTAHHVTAFNIVGSQYGRTCVVLLVYSRKPANKFDMAKFIVLCLTVCLAYIHSGYALKCYSCDSTKVAACQDGSDLKNVPLTECSAASGSPGVSEVSCMKITTQGVNNGPMNTTRKCVMHPHGVDACVSARGKLPPTMELKFCEMCNSDGCNAAGSIGAPLYAIVALCLAAIANIYARA